MKLCSKCGCTKPLYEFYRDSNKADGKRTICIICHQDSVFQRTYGISREEYYDMLDIQDGRCAICERHHKELTRRLAVDHCHHTGEVRGLLCSNCNTGIGNLRDNVELLSKAIQYLGDPYAN